MTGYDTCRKVGNMLPQCETCTKFNPNFIQNDPEFNYNNCNLYHENELTASDITPIINGEDHDCCMYEEE